MMIMVVVRIMMVIKMMICYYHYLYYLTIIIKIPLASDERISEFPQKNSNLTLFITFIAADDDW